MDLLADESPWTTCPHITLLAVDTKKLQRGSGLTCADEALSVRLWGRHPCCGACLGWSRCEKSAEAHLPQKMIVAVPTITRE